MPFVDNLDRIKARIKEISELVKILQAENSRLKGKVLEHELALKEKEFLLENNKKNVQILLALERENKQFQADRKYLQEAVSQMIEELRGL